ncbi:DUF2752 domain-containing protein [Domibacillus indicus]|uniref:DUF2752 domain-containing protein n=1 Tax=Domibacillus indicus TaxID=1437523 RepID=UPI00203E9343|nr:DUF2752 domain-containing protein [Domibacillus indicus]MCM3790311.1 DUF2752 domain-containing protein [Domibacillus indicus]
MIGATFLIAALIYLKVLSPKWGLHIPCLFREVTGFYCPGCGVTRASLALIDGNLYQSFRYNMLVYVLIPFFGLYIYWSYKGNRVWAERLMISAAILALLFGIIRNTEIGAFLAPVSL